MQRENYRTMAVKQEAVDDFMAYIETYFQKTGELSQNSSLNERKLTVLPLLSLQREMSILVQERTRRYVRNDNLSLVPRLT